jgi:hypothetical protein
MPKIFSCPSMTFDHEPYDSELTCLLGEGSWLDELPIGIQWIENSGVASIGPKRLHKALLIFLLFVLGAINVACIVYLFFSPWLKMILRLIIVLVSGPLIWFLSILFYHSNKNNDFFKIDISRRRLELYRIGRAASADEIVAFSELIRWQRRNLWVDYWRKVRQTDVLVHGPNRCVQWHPLICCYESQWSSLLSVLQICKRRTSLADRLANIFQKPVRRITLDKKESKALNDY